MMTVDQVRDRLLSTLRRSGDPVEPSSHVCIGMNAQGVAMSESTFEYGDHHPAQLSKPSERTEQVTCL